MDEGLLIVFEGIDGAGLTTQAERTKEKLDEWWETYHDGEPTNGPFACLEKEPTDGPFGAPIRMALNERLTFDSLTWSLAFAADRSDHLHKEIEPKLAEGKLVILDRYYHSSLAYQSTEIDDFDWLRTINSKFRSPDLTIMLDISPDESSERIENGRFNKELFEQKPKLKQVRDNYRRVAETLREEGEDIEIVEANRPRNRVGRDIMSHVYRKLRERDVGGVMTGTEE